MNKSKKDTKKTPAGTSIVGDANIIGNNNSAQVIKVSSEADKYRIEAAVLSFLQEINLDKKISKSDRDAAIKEAKELQSTLQSENPDLGKVQQFKKFIQEKGGGLASAGLKLLLEPAIKLIIESATKKILE